LKTLIEHSSKEPLIRAKKKKTFKFILALLTVAVKLKESFSFLG